MTEPTSTTPAAELPASSRSYRFDLSDTQYDCVMDESRIIWIEGPAGEGKTYCWIAGLFRHYQRMRETLMNRQLEALLAGAHPDTLAEVLAQKPPTTLARHTLLVEAVTIRLGAVPVEILSLMLPRPMLVAIVRDTFINVKLNTIKSITKGFPGAFAFHDGGRLMLEKGVQPKDREHSWIEANLFGLDHLDSLDRIQGGEYDAIVLEEPAPVLSTGNNGMREEVYRVSQQRIRGGDLPKRLQIPMNPADEDHWTSKQIDDCERQPVLMVDGVAITRKVYRIKPGENAHLSAEDRAANRAAYAGRADLTARFVEGKRAKVYAGVKVTPEYSDDMHLSRVQLDPIPGTLCYRFWDGGLNPTCVFAQLTPSGRFFFLDCVMLPNGGMRQLILQKVIPLLNSKRYQGVVRRWRDLGDPSLDNREQSNSEHRASLVIETELKTVFEKGEMLWEPRKEALKEAFMRTVQMSDGVAPFVQISPHVSMGESTNWLKAAFSGGYCYQVTADGRVVRDGPLKNQWSHPGDAVSHGMAKLFTRPKGPATPQKPKAEQQRIARSYAVE